MSATECVECYSADPRATPLLEPEKCLRAHTQYVCGTCGRCICIEADPVRGLHRWNFPFRSLDVARLYLRAADATMGRACGIYAIDSANGRRSYKIFTDRKELAAYLEKNRGRTCASGEPEFETGRFLKFAGARIRRLEPDEVERYLAERA